MANGKARMLFRGQTPGHDLRRQLNGRPTVREAITAKDLTSPTGLPWQSPLGVHLHLLKL
jgi:hypothetical protein